MALGQNTGHARRQQRARENAPGATGPGSVGRLLDDGSPARVLLDGQEYGPVPVVGRAEAGGRVFLHLDMRGEPAYAQSAEAALPDPGSGDKSYHHIQSSASTVWSIPHGFGRVALVRVFDSVGRERKPSEQPGESTTVLTFNAAVAGDAYLS